jgi:hypothetical protein
MEESCMNSVNLELQTYLESEQAQLVPNATRTALQTRTQQLLLMERTMTKKKWEQQKQM